jgi:spermidine synthase
VSETGERGADTAYGTASVLFFLSGATALAWEVVWFKRFTQLFGSSSLAMASVVAAFLFGLGIGAYLFGRVADRLRRPLLVYALCELGIGVTALGVPWAIGQLFGLSAPLHAGTGGSALMLALARFGLTLLVLGPPCVLMGGTLPLLVAQFAGQGRERTVGSSTSWLYATNALGAATGAWVAGFKFLPAIGLLATSNVAVALNLVVGFVALALARGLPDTERERPAAGSPATARILIAAGLAGCGALVLQMLWARQLALLLGGSTYSFTATIAVFVLGVGLGSLLFRLLLARGALAQVVVAGATVVVVISTLVGLEVAPYLSFLIGGVREMRFEPGFDAALSGATALALEGLPTIAMGALFPALVQLAAERGGGAGRSVGTVYAANTLGSIAGATLAAAVLLPALGSFLTFRLALGLYVVLLLLLFPPVRLPQNRSALAALVVCALGLVATWSEPDPRDMNLGRFLYGPDDGLLAGLGMEPVFFAEGATTNVLVLEGVEAVGPPEAPPGTHPLHLRVNGKVDASNTGDMLMQLGHAYFPRLLNPGAEDVLVIGLGSGSSTGASLLFPDTRVTCCEIEPALAEASKLFGAVNHRPLDSPRLELIFDDGRSHVQGSEARYDLILSEPSNPWLAGVSNLYTVEFYEAAALRLKPGGLLAQWVQTYALTPMQYALIVKTVTSVFPDAALLRVSDFDTILVAGARGVLPTVQELDSAQALVDSHAAITRDLRFYFGSSDVRSLLLEHLYLTVPDLARFATTYGDGGVITDLNLRLEFEAPHSLFVGDVLRAETNRAILASGDPALQQRLFLDWRCDTDQVEALRTLKTALFMNERMVHAATLVQLALAYEPDDPELLVDRVLFGPFMPQEEFEQTVARLLDLSPLESYRLGSTLAQTGRVEPARLVLEGVTAVLPDSATAWSSLAAVYATLGLESEMNAAVGRASGLDPMNDLVRGMQRALEARDWPR